MFSKRLIILTLLPVLCMWPVIANAQFPGLYRSFSIENSDLPSNVVYRMLCDRYGYIWCATSNGFVKFNGNQFEKVALPITEDEIVNVYQKKDTLFLFNFTGQTAVVNLKNHSIVPAGTLKQWPDDNSYAQPISIAAAIKDTVYFADMSHDVLHYKVAGGKVYCKTSRNILWDKLRLHYQVPPRFPSPDTIYRIGIRDIHSVQFLEESIIVDNTIYYLRKDKIELGFDGNLYGLKGTIMAHARINNDLYVGYYEHHGLVKFKNYFNRAKNEKPICLIGKKRILSLAPDRNNNLWVSIYNEGLVMLPFGLDNVKTYNTDNTAMHRNDINYVQQEGKRLYIAYKDGHIDIKDSNHVVPLRLSFPEGNYDINYIGPGADCWNIFTRAGIISFRAPISGHLAPAPVISMHKFPVKDVVYADKKYWIAAKANAATMNRNSDSLYKIPLPEATMSLTVTPETQMIYGTLRGLYVNNQIISGTEGDRFNIVRYFDGDIVACSMSAVYLIRSGKIVKRFSVTDGLVGNRYLDVKTGNDGYYYIRSERGINVIEKAGLKVAGVFNGQDFIVPIAINSFSINSGVVVLGTNKGLFEIPASYFYTVQPGPPVYIRQLVQNGEVFTFDHGRSVKYQKHLSIHLRVDVLDYKGGKPRIWYIIARDGKIISDTAYISGNVLHLDNPAPGNYIIKAGVCSLQEQWMVSCDYNFTVTPLWYQTMIFRIFCTAILVLLIVGLVKSLYQRRLALIEQKFKTRNRITELESKALFAQMKPHFIFNALNPLQGFILKNKKEHALDYLEKFAGLTRELLNQSRDRYSTIEREIAFIEHYLFIACTRFAESFTYNITIAPEVDKNLILPTMLMQPLVENSVEHGVMMLGAGKGVIQIDIGYPKDKDQLIIRIADNGPGFPLAELKKENHALTIIKERLALLRAETGVGDIFLLRNHELQQTEVTLLLPLINENP